MQEKHVCRASDTCACIVQERYVWRASDICACRVQEKYVCRESDICACEVSEIGVFSHVQFPGAPGSCGCALNSFRRVECQKCIYVGYVCRVSEMFLLDIRNVVYRVS